MAGMAIMATSKHAVKSTIQFVGFELHPKQKKIYFTYLYFSSRLGTFYNMIYLQFTIPKIF